MQSTARRAARWASSSFRRVRTPRTRRVCAPLERTERDDERRIEGKKKERERERESESGRGKECRGCLESKFLSPHVNRYVDGPIEGLSTYFCIPFLRRADPVRLEWKSISRQRRHGERDKEESLSLSLSREIVSRAVLRLRDRINWNRFIIIFTGCGRKLLMREKWINNLINIPDCGRMFVGKKGVQHVSLTFVRCRRCSLPKLRMLLCTMCTWEKWKHGTKYSIVNIVECR